MRIISGDKRGRSIITPSSNNIRPTMDRAKEGVFNVINMDIYNSKFLDLFSGTGSLGFEAASRGADQVTLVDSARESISLISKNKTALDLNVNIVQADCLEFISNTKQTFDIIIMDPPYDFNIDILNEIIKNSVSKLNEFGCVIIEVDMRTDLDMENYNHIKTKKYGISKFYFVGPYE